MHSYSLFVVAAVSVFSSQVYAATSADPLAIATVAQQFVNAKIVPDAISSFTPVSLVSLDFGGTVNAATVGEAIAKDDVADQPKLASTGIPTEGLYTVLLIDANYVGSSNPSGLNLHWLQNNVAFGADGTMNATTNATIPYAGPGPASGSGPHRYTFLVYTQPSTFTAPATPKANSGVALFDLATYVKAASLSTPVAGTYFTVEVGTATVSVGSTSAVNVATLSVAGSSAAGATGTGTAKASGTGTATGTAASSTGTSPSSGAGRTTVVGAGLVAWVGVLGALLA